MISINIHFFCLEEIILYFVKQHRVDKKKIDGRNSGEEKKVELGRNISDTTTLHKKTSWHILLNLFALITHKLSYSRGFPTPLSHTNNRQFVVYQKKKDNLLMFCASLSQTPKSSKYYYTI